MMDRWQQQHHHHDSEQDSDNSLPPPRRDEVVSRRPRSADPYGFVFADNTISSPLVQCNDTSEEPSPSSAAASIVSSTEERLRQIASISSDAAAAARERERALMRLKSADRGTLEREHRVTTTENPVDTLLIYWHNAALQQQQQT
mmetsp:Transcript_12222/g.30664  ORF Transcript_12222/g.30664 Transcript_12222/m.30664 type:complete len:145 (+) Transcript_12222:134-568(+)